MREKNLIRRAWSAWCELCGRYEATPDKHAGMILSIAIFWICMVGFVVWSNVEPGKIAGGQVNGNLLVAVEYGPLLAVLAIGMICAAKMEKYAHKRKWTLRQNLFWFGISLPLLGLFAGLGAWNYSFALSIAPFLAWFVLGIVGQISHLLTHPKSPQSQIRPVTLDPSP